MPSLALSGLPAPALLHAVLLLDLPSEALSNVSSVGGGGYQRGVRGGRGGEGPGSPPVKYSNYRADSGAKPLDCAERVPLYFPMPHTLDAARENQSG